MLSREENRQQQQQHTTICHNDIENTPTQLSDLLAQEDLNEINRARNLTKTDSLTVISQNSMKPTVPVYETYCSQGNQISRNHNQMANNWPSIWENINPIEDTVNSYPTQDETDIEHQGGIDNLSPISRENYLNNASFAGDQQSIHNSYQTQLNFNRLSHLNVFNSNVGALFHGSETNLPERFTDQSNSMYDQPSLRHDVLHSDFLNRELFDFDTDLLESNEEHSLNIAISDNFVESLEREIEQSNEATQLSSTIDEDNSTNEYRSSVSDIYSDASIQTSDAQLEQSNHSVEFQSQFYEKSVELDKRTETNEIWKERGNELMNQLKNKQNNKHEQNTGITVNENDASNPEGSTKLAASRQLRVSSEAKKEHDSSDVIEDVIVDNVKNLVKNAKAGGGPIVFGNCEEALFYELRMKEIDAIDSAISSIEQKIKMDSNCYDLDRTNVKNIDTFQYIKYNKGVNESFIPVSIEITVMPLKIQPEDSAVPPETEEPEDSSETQDPTEMSEGSNVPESSTPLEMEPCQEAISQRKKEKDQLPDEKVATSMASPTESSSLTQIKPIGTCSTSAHNPHDDKTQEKKSEDKESGPDCFGKTQRVARDNEIIEMVDKNDPNAVEDEFAFIRKTEKKSSEEGIEKVISETMANTAVLEPVISSEDLLPTESEVQEKFETQDCKGELLVPNIFEFSKKLEITHLVTVTQSETNNDQVLKEELSTEVLSNQLSTEPQMQKALCSSSHISTQSDNIPDKGLENEHGCVSMESDRPNRLGEQQTFAPDTETDHAVTETDANIVEHTTIDKAKLILQESEIKEGENTDIASSSNEQNTPKASSTYDLSSGIGSRSVETKTEHSEKFTESIIQGTVSLTSLELATLPKHQLLSETKTQEISGTKNFTAVLSDPNTSETSAIQMDPIGKTCSQTETKTDKSPNEGTFTGILAMGPSSLPLLENEQSSSSVHSSEGDNKPEKRTEDEDECVIMESGVPNQVVSKNDHNIVEETTTIDNTKENQHYESKVQPNEQIDVTLKTETNTHIDIKAHDMDNNSAGSTRSIETKCKHSDGTIDSNIQETMVALPTASATTLALPEPHLPCEIKTQRTSDVLNPAEELPEPNTQESSIIHETNPLGKTASQTETNIEQSPREESTTEISSFEPSFLTQTQDAPILDEPSIQETIHDNIVINISPSELAWLSEPATQSEIGSHPCFEQLENFQIEQAPLSIEGILQIPTTDTPRNQEPTEEPSGHIYSEQLGGSSLPGVSEMVEKKLPSEQSAISETENVSSEAGPEPAIPDDLPPQRSSICLTSNETTVVSSESEPSISVKSDGQSVASLEPVPSSSESTLLVEKDAQPIADEPSDDEAPLAKRKRTESKSNMKLRVKETRKSSRVKKNPERLFYIGKGQLF